jgi:hypothetical protein
MLILNMLVDWFQIIFHDPSVKLIHELPHASAFHLSSVAAYVPI